MKLIICDITKISIKEDFDRIIDTLEAKARERILRFRQEKDRFRALARDGLLSYVLREAYPGRSVALSKNEYGKPFISQILPPPANADPIAFNISHSGDLVIIGYGKGQIGVDVEYLERLSDVDKMLRFFSSDENRLVNSSEDHVHEFIRIWTYREAFSKLIGEGIPLFSREPVAIRYDTKDVCYHGRWFYFSEISYPMHQICVCTGEKNVPIEVYMADQSVWDEIFFSIAYSSS